MKNDTYTHCFYASELKYLKLRAFFFFTSSTSNASFTALKPVVYRKCRHFTYIIEDVLCIMVCVCVRLLWF